jgi:hypothetical protein
MGMMLMAQISNRDASGYLSSHPSKRKNVVGRILVVITKHLNHLMITNAINIAINIHPIIANPERQNMPIAIRSNGTAAMAIKTRLSWARPTTCAVGGVVVWSITILPVFGSTVANNKNATKNARPKCAQSHPVDFIPL